MTTKFLPIIAALLGVLLTSCITRQKTFWGAASGAPSAGDVNRAEVAIHGGLIGGYIHGGLIGGYGTPEDLIDRKRSRMNDDAIIAHIDKGGSVYRLSDSDVKSLREAGVSQRVIDHAKATRTSRSSASASATEANPKRSPAAGPTSGS